MLKMQGNCAQTRAAVHTRPRQPTILTPSGVVSGKAAKTLRGLFHPLSLQNDYHSNNGNKKWPSQGHALAMLAKIYRSVRKCIYLYL